jgi:hypothetical protein
MCETLRPVTAGFNRSLSIETQAERLTGDPDAVLLREVLEAVQPVQLAGDTKSSLVQMPNAAFGKLVALNRSRRSWQTRSSGISC